MQGLINTVSFLFDQQIFTAFDIVAKEEKKPGVFRFYLNLDKGLHDSRTSSCEYILLIRKLLKVVLDAKDRINTLKAEVPRDPRVTFLMLALKKCLRTSIERGAFRRMKRRFTGFLVPFLITRYISTFLQTK